MFLSQYKILLFGLALAVAFGSGWRVNGWRLQANHVKTLEELTVRMQEKLTDQADAFKLGANTLRLRETQLLQDLTDERAATEVLQDEIANTPIVERIVHIPVAGECPVCATIDSVRYRALYNRAATGALSGAGTGDLTLSGSDNTG